MTEDDSDYRCSVCGIRYVVRILARDCEAQHRGETAVDR